MSHTAFRLEYAGLVHAVMVLWDKKKDTADMALLLHQPECEVARALYVGRELKMRSND